MPLQSSEESDSESVLDSGSVASSATADIWIGRRRRRSRAVDKSEGEGSEKRINYESSGVVQSGDPSQQDESAALSCSASGSKSTGNEYAVERSDLPAVDEITRPRTSGHRGLYDWRTGKFAGTSQGDVNTTTAARHPQGHSPRDPRVQKAFDSLISDRVSLFTHGANVERKRNCYDDSYERLVFARRSHHQFDNDTKIYSSSPPYERRDELSNRVDEWMSLIPSSSNEREDERGTIPEIKVMPSERRDVDTNNVIQHSASQVVSTNNLVEIQAGISSPSYHLPDRRQGQNGPVPSFSTKMPKMTSETPYRNALLRKPTTVARSIENSYTKSDEISYSADPVELLNEKLQRSSAPAPSPYRDALLSINSPIADSRQVPQPGNSDTCTVMSQISQAPDSYPLLAETGIDSTSWRRADSTIDTAVKNAHEVARWRQPWRRGLQATEVGNSNWGKTDEASVLPSTLQDKNHQDQRTLGQKHEQIARDGHEDATRSDIKASTANTWASRAAQSPRLELPEVEDVKMKSAGKVVLRRRGIGRHE